MASNSPDFAPFITARHLKVVLWIGHVAAWLFLLWQLDPDAEWGTWILAAFPLVMTIHQLEENVLTEAVLGPTYAFLRWVKTIGFDISPGRALALNCGVGWTLAIAAACLGLRFPGFTLFVMLVEAVNGFWHVATAVRTRRWSPGIISSVAITIPVTLALTVWYLQLNRIAPTTILLCLVAAIISHAMFLNSLPKLQDGNGRPGEPPSVEHT